MFWLLQSCNLLYMYHVYFTECPVRGLDLAFVLDSSGSVTEPNFELAKEFIVNVSRTFAIGPEDTQVAIVRFSGFASIAFRLNENSNASSLITAIRNVEYLPFPRRQANTYTADGLRVLREEVMTTEAGARPEIFAIPRVMIVVTDGRSNINESQTIPQAELVREAGITAFAAGVIGNKGVNMDELNAIASSPSFVSLLSSFTVVELQGLQRTLSAEACMGKSILTVKQKYK